MRTPGQPDVPPRAREERTRFRTASDDSICPSFTYERRDVTLRLLLARTESNATATISLRSRFHSASPFRSPLITIS